MIDISYTSPRTCLLHVKKRRFFPTAVFQLHCCLSGFLCYGLILSGIPTGQPHFAVMPDCLMPHMPSRHVQFHRKLVLACNMVAIWTSEIQRGVAFCHYLILYLAARVHP